MSGPNLHVFTLKFLGLKKSSGHKGVNSSGHFFRVLVDNVWVNSSGNFCWVNSSGQCLGEF